MNKIIATTSPNSDIIYGDSYRIRALGIEWLNNPSDQDLEKVAQLIMDTDNWTRWARADLVLEAIDRSVYPQIAGQFMVTASTLDNWAYTARQWPLETRVMELTFTHHQLLASYSKEDKRKMVDYCIKKDISSTELRKLVNKSNGNNYPEFGSDRDKIDVLQTENQMLAAKLSYYEQQEEQQQPAERMITSNSVDSVDRILDELLPLLNKLKQERPDLVKYLINYLSD